MKRLPTSISCPHSNCPSAAAPDSSTVVRHSYLKTRTGKKQRWRCKLCRRTFTRRSGTPYHRLHASPELFDRAIKMAVAGSSKAAIAQVLDLSRSTVERWIERAAWSARAFSDRVVHGVDPNELQADELRSYTACQRGRTYVFSVIDVDSRLWLSQKVGNRSLRNCRLVMNDARSRCAPSPAPCLIVTDRFKFYAESVRRAWGPTCVHAQVRKKIIKKRVVANHVDLMSGTQWQLEMALARSESSGSINSAFVERLNLFMRSGLSYLHRRTQSIPQRVSKLAESVDLLQCFYNFIRPHGSLQRGRERRTPGMEGGLVKRVLTFRDVFESGRAGARASWICDRRSWNARLVRCGAATVPGTRRTAFGEQLLVSSAANSV